MRDWSMTSMFSSCDIEKLDLRNPIYSKTASYGHFGREEFSWEKTDKAEALSKEI